MSAAERPPLGQEWEILNKAVDYDPRQWDGLMSECNDRIEQVRKRPITLRLTDRAGKPIAGRTFRVVQTRSDFLWGFGGWGLLNCLRDGSMAREDVHRRYHYLAELFNTVNLTHYWVEKHCGRAPVNEEFQGFADYENTQQGVDWALARGLVPKGHPIFWPVPKAIPQWLYKYDAPTRMKFLEVRVRTLCARFRGKMGLYDAVNEMLWEPHIADVEKRHWPHITPVERMVDYIQPVLHWARQEDPDARYLINDYGILLGSRETIPVPANTGETIDRDFQTQRYQELLLALRKAGAAPDAVGIQSFFGNWAIHRQALETMDFLGTQTGLPVIITEFGNSGVQLRAMREAGLDEERIAEAVGQWVEHSMTVCFSHPACEGFYFWYLADMMHNAGGYPSPFYHRLRELIHNRWRTQQMLHTDDNGQASFRGFCGQYRVYLTGGGHPVGTGFHIPETSRGEFRLELALPA